MEFVFLVIGGLVGLVVGVGDNQPLYKVRPKKRSTITEMEKWFFVFQCALLLISAIIAATIAGLYYLFKAVIYI